jgi:hypothetical protein
MKENIKKTQYDLIREDINLIEKYYGTDNFDGLINDILIHIASAEQQNKELQDRIDKIKTFIEIQIEIIKQQPYNDLEINEYFTGRFKSILSILDKKGNDE